VVNVVTGFGETAGAALAAHDHVDKVAFTGSTEVGKLIVQAATGNLKKVSLELGGKSPNIVFDDAEAGAVEGAAVEPTVITNTRPDMKIVREEIFGPVVVAVPFRTLDDIAKEANNSDYGLGAGIWTRDISKAHALAKKLRAGTV
jgi:acyl-CoA reductase-like NAD-dependent aldehyde dehydrogenase